MSCRVIPTPRFQKDVKYLKKKYRHIASDLEEFNNIKIIDPKQGGKGGRRNEKCNTRNYLQKSY